ncbi:polysaccharide biosynthesis protein [Kocuria sp. p3-SID1433]|uniref:polysaccharide biosynthesis protein n=1 Tax=unclassified Kocuria TaxID=2649579 RepID=UPI0021A7B142|nr:MULTISPECIES: nucleoside-diphosphate sugar epimerase/dehydratase [unclassified Kocuria]MCT1601731.1 polysaccharide biosynthesis protein [Kocuria sp. p3-SID1428]MCT2180081.1 polysaccharide biosynthesis protein [Kocuria sp. p3-SID1433]
MQPSHDGDGATSSSGLTGSASLALSRAAADEKPTAWLWIQMILDSMSWIVAMTVALVLRYELNLDFISPLGMFVMCAVAVVSQLAVGYSFALYRGRYSFGSFDEAKLLVVVTVIVAAILQILLLVTGPSVGVPRSIALIAFPFACLLMAAFRYLKRMYQESTSRPGEAAQHVVVYGAGQSGMFIIQRMMQDPDSEYVPVGIIDDDPAKKHLRISSVPVLGTLDDATHVLEQTRSQILLVAMSGVDSKKLQRVADTVAGTGTRVMTVPPLSSMLTGSGSSVDIRDVNLEDLIGRSPVDIDTQGISGYIAGRRVLVTGAGGSIGSELCRQLLAFEPGELMMLDRDETNLQSTQISITGRGLLDGQDTVLADIRDAEAIEQLFLERRPEVVFHAAALKHVSLLETYPDEAWKTNVLGTLNVLEAARKADVGVFVNVSTDKAANPTTALGHSKRVAEKLTAWMAQETGKRYASVRFGNVFGSRGSMLPLFTEQIRQGGPITVTDAQATRYFMTIPEACQLVVQAGAIARGGEVLILDMGEPIRILDIAERLRTLSGRESIEIVITGLRPGEKLHEELIGLGESDERPFHPKISHAKAAALSPEGLDRHTWKLRGNMPTTGMIPVVRAHSQPSLTDFRAARRESSSVHDIKPVRGTDSQAVRPGEDELPYDQDQDSAS